MQIPAYKRDQRGFSLLEIMVVLASSHNGTPRLLEVNPNPGSCWDGHLAKMAKLQGMSYIAILASIVEACESRIETTGTN